MFDFLGDIFSAFGDAAGDAAEWAGGAAESVGDFAGAAWDVPEVVGTALSGPPAEAGGSWLSSLNSLMPYARVAGSIAGPVLGYMGNQNAAEAARAAAERQARLIQQGNQQAQQRFDTAWGIAQPSITRLGQIAAGPDASGLFPWQRSQLGDIRRESARTLANSGLRGSGAAMTKVLKDTEVSARNRFAEANQGRSDRAAGTLAGQGFQANTAGANLAALTGTRLGQVEGGRGDVDAGLEIANAKLAGGALGDVISTINQESKGRSSRFGANKTAEDVTNYYRGGTFA